MVRGAGEEVYDGNRADALERDLRPPVGGPVVKTLTRPGRPYPFSEISR